MNKNKSNSPLSQSFTNGSRKSTASSFFNQIIDGLRKRAEERYKSSGQKSRNKRTLALQETPTKTKQAVWVYANRNRVTKFLNAHLNYGGKHHLREVCLKRNLKKIKRCLTNVEGVYFEVLKPGQCIWSNSHNRAKFFYLGGKYGSLLRRDTCWKKIKML